MTRKRKEGAIDSSESENEAEPVVMSNFVSEPLSTAFEHNCTNLRKDYRDITNVQTWLEIPDNLMNPKKMCAVNQFVHIIPDLRPDDQAYLDEYVLVHYGPTIPDHFRWMVQCMNYVNLATSIKDSFTPVQGITKAVEVQFTSGKGKTKKFDVIGVSRLVQVPTGEEPTHLTDFIATSEKQRSFRTDCNHLSSTGSKPCFARVNNVTMSWGFVPVEYTQDSVQRKLFQVLRIVPQPGFNLIHFIRKNYFEKRNESKHRDFGKINEVCNLLQQIVNHEADINYGLKGTWDSSLPNPWMVEEPTNPTSVQRLLSPYTVLRRMLQHIKGGYCGPVTMSSENSFLQESLMIDGFPDLDTAENAQNAITYFEKLQSTYLSALRAYEVIFHKNLRLFHQNSAETFPVMSLLSEKRKNFDSLPTKLNMIFCLENYKDTDRLGIPKLGMAMMDMFLFFERSDLFTSMTIMDFVIAHVGELMTTQIVTVSEIAKKYKLNSDMQSLEDFPRAGLHKSARDTFKRNAKKMIDLQVDKDVVSEQLGLFYINYLKLQFTATKNGLIMDSWMSDRVYRSALLMEQLIGQKDSCNGIYKALQWAHEFRSTSNTSYNQLVHIRCGYVWHRLNLAICKLNESIKANPMNLALIWGMLKGDVLTFMGLHNQTWRWMMYCMQIAPCWGHLRTVTEDGHAARSECTLTAKPNSVGLNEVVIKTTNYCLVDLLSYIVNMTSEDMQALKLEKVDRKTRVSIESGHSCEFANNKLINKPSPGTLMQAAAIDEALRSFDESGLAGLINTGLPRDSNAGEGTTTKCLKPQNGYMEKGETRQLPGMGFFALIFATNTNARNATIAEMLRTLACGAMVTYSPGCPDTPGLSSSLATRDKRKRGQQLKNSQCTGESMLPMDPEICSKLAYLISVSGTYARHVALVNKTGQSNWEISYPLLQYMSMMQELFLLHFSNWISANYVQSASRQFKGVIARGVASCLYTTIIGNLEFVENVDNANFQSLLQMENSALSLYWANIVLLNGFTHLIDSSIYLVNQLIKWKLRVPVIRLEFLCSILDPDKALDENCSDYKNLFAFLGRLKAAKTRDVESSSNDPIKHFTGSYVQVEGLGNISSYNQIEKYLFQYCGINIGSQYTYLKLFRDAAHRSLDLTALLDLTHSMMDIRIFFSRCNIPYEDHWYCPPGGNHEKGTNYLILIEDKADIKGQTTVGTVWVHAVQTLFINALLGTSELHSDNSIKLGQEIFKLLIRQYAPIQAVPSIVLLCETFKTQYGDVVGDVFSVPTNKCYFFRHRIDYAAWKTGLSKDACIVQNHPIEDVLHMHSWVQVHYTLIGSLPKKFYYIPQAVQRPPELVPGRIYPIICYEEGTTVLLDGLIQISPNGRSFVLISLIFQDRERREMAVNIDLLALSHMNMNFQVGPLISRKHAVILQEGKLYLLQKQPTRDMKTLMETLELRPEHLDTMFPDAEVCCYLNYKGYYKLHNGAKLHWTLAHDCLLPLGTHFAVELSHFNKTLDFFHLKNKVPTSKDKPENFVMGWLRYPDECDLCYGDETKIFLSFRVAAYPTDFDEILVIPFEIDGVRLLQDIGAGCKYVDYILPVD